MVLKVPAVRINISLAVESVFSIGGENICFQTTFLKFEKGQTD